VKFESNAKLGQPVENGSIFRAKAGGLHITVHKIIHYEGWYLSCAEVGIRDRELKSESLLKAIREAEIVIKKKVEKTQKDIAKAIGENIEISRY
jgi:hypothetical protein